VSSDSDYTRLATRIRESGIFVMGIGERKTPKAFVNACDVFVFTENLAAEKKAMRQKQDQTKKTGSGKHKQEGEKEELDPMPVLSQAFEMAVREDGWAPLATLGQAIYQVDPSFDPRTYGHKQLSRMIAKLKDRFEIRTQEAGGTTVMYVKMKE
jgi:Fe-S-cluster formation regulator IscX/YfhJ